jgi:hypothetical protein
LSGVPLLEGQAVIMFRNDMIRELQLIELGQDLEGVGPSELDSVAKVLRDDLEWLRDEFAGNFRAVDPDALVPPITDPDLLVDYVADLHPDAAIRIKRVVGHVEDLNWFSSHGQLLTVGASPVVMDLVRWLRDEAIGQLVEGRAPRPFARRPG